VNNPVGSTSYNYGATLFTNDSTTAVKDTAKIELKPVEVPQYSKNDNVSAENMKDGGIAPLSIVDKNGKELPNGEVFMLVDEAGKPVMGPNNEQIGILVDGEGKPIQGKDGQPILVDKNGSPLSNPANEIMAWMEKPSVKRVTDGIMNKYFATSTLKSGVNLLVKGTAITVPFTGKVIGWGAQKAVVDALAKTVPTIVAENTAKVAGKAIVKSIDKAVVTATVEASLKTAEKAVPKITQQALEKAVIKGTETALKNAGKGVAKATVTKAGQEAIIKTASEAAVKTTATTGAKVGSKLSVIIPAVGVAIGVGITAWDTKVAIEKQSNPHISGVSKGLAWATVGLDAIATGCSGVGAAAAAGVVTAPVTVVTTVVGAVATGLSIATSVLSDIFE